MKPRVFVSLELYPRIAALVPGMDDLDIAYACSRAGADGIMVNVPTESAGRESLVRFDRPGLPLLCVHSNLQQLHSLPSLGTAPDRFLISDEGRPVMDFDAVTDFKQRVSGTHQEIAVLIEPEPQMLKIAAKARVEWVAFSTSELQNAVSLADAEQELLKLRTVTTLAARNSLRVMMYGDIERHLARSVASLEGVEELVPVNTLWTLALRHGWEKAVETFRNWID